MKLKLTLLTTLLATTLFATPIIPYNNSKPPSLSLPNAYDDAIMALGDKTNQFHCIRAEIATTFSHNGEWLFTFYSTNSTPKWITVEFNGKIHVEDIMIR